MDSATTEAAPDTTDDAQGDQGGATLIIFALTIVILMGFAAFAVDYAAALVQRRANQGAADLGALAGMQFTAELGHNAAMEAAEDEIIRITYSSLRPEMTPDEWRAAWLTCRDDDKTWAYTEYAHSECISFTSNLERLRVRLPTIPVETSFGKILGRDVIETSATAVVGLELTGGGGVLPFGLPGGAAGQAHICLKTGSNPQNQAPCDGPDSGNFGFLDITQFGSLEIGTTQQCTGGGDDRLAANIARGVDHPLGVAAAQGSTPRVDRTLCPTDNYAARPYTLTTETGNGKGGAVTEGFAEGIDGYPGRLTQSDNTVTIAGNSIDDTPLWDFLSIDGQGFCGSVANHEELETCLASWTSGDPVLFDVTIDDSTRFGWVPLFWSNTFGSGTGDHNIRAHRPVYVQTTFWKCNASNCAYVHDPGEPIGGTGGGGNIGIDAVTAFNLQPGMLPTDVREAGPGSGGDTIFALVE